MFTGIIRYTGEIASIKKSGEGSYFTIQADKGVLEKLEKGITSISVNGACHTVSEVTSGGFTTYSSFETLSRTSQGLLKSHDRVNLELPLTPTTLLDGHLVQGHVDGTGSFIGMKKKGEAYLAKFTAGHDIIKYLVEKDSIAIDGISLTIFNISEDTFEVAMIPETASRTTLGKKSPGDPVNLEVNIFAKYVYRFTGQTGKKIADFIIK